MLFAEILPCISLMAFAVLFVNCCWPATVAQNSFDRFARGPEGPGDLPVTTNYRDVLAPLLSWHSPDVNLRQVFPDFDRKPVDILG